jgi:hypothetical protein
MAPGTKVVHGRTAKDSIWPSGKSSLRTFGAAFTLAAGAARSFDNSPITDQSP